MANNKQLFVTPVAPIRWCKLLGAARENQFEPTKLPTWSCELLLSQDNQAHQQWLLMMEDQLQSAHPGAPKISRNGLPWQQGEKTEKDDDTGLVIVRFKLPCFTRKDGSTSPGPKVIDADKQPWDQAVEIGNGSQVRIAASIYPWSGPSGVGMTLEPMHVQVIAHIPMVRNEAEDVDAIFPDSPQADAIPF